MPAWSYFLRGVLDAAGGTYWLMAGATCATSNRRKRTVGQKRGIRAGSKSDSSLERSACGAVGSTAACDPSAVLCGWGSASNASTEQIGKTSIKSIKFKSPLGWKKDTAVDGTPKPIRYDQCDSLKRRRCVSLATYLFQRPSPHRPDLFEAKVAVDHRHDQERERRPEVGNALQAKAPVSYTHLRAHET